MTQWVYRFGEGKADGRAEMKNLLGGKGANLAEMSNLGLPVPPGFTITTEVCTYFYQNAKAYPAGLEGDVKSALGSVETQVGRKFGDADNPLLVSVRSGARVSMPGMMDTVLNLGLNDKTAAGLAKRTGNPRFAYDSYRRFIQMYGHVVLGVDHHHFEELLELHKEDRGVSLDTELGAEDWQKLIEAYKAKVKEELGEAFPQDPLRQLWGAIGAVFGSWLTARAVTYRKLHNIPENWGTAVNVQAMVFGNMGDDCATGVAFTRNPSTGANEFYGEFLVNAQGEDVVAGIRTPQHLTIAGKKANRSTLPAMEEAMTAVFGELDGVRKRLESHYRDMQDIEFTVERGKLYMLQTRSGKRTAQAALKVAVDMVGEGLIDRRQAVSRIDPASLDQLQAEDRGARGEKVILVRTETSPEDIHGMHAAVGVLTTRGGMTSHAAVVARGMGRPCVSGAGDLRIDEAARIMKVRDVVVRDGDLLTIDGGTGEVMLGEVPTIQPELSGDFSELMTWADQFRRLKVRTNAETPTDARMARRFGAEGIGLCRTEHMFFDGGRIVAMREMIVADTTEGRRAALAKIMPMQRDDFVELFRIMRGLPVTIRLLDPPLHEFLPNSRSEMEEVAKAAGVSTDHVAQRAAMLKESNPMLGHRGCRLGITYPEVYEMQARAIFEAATLVKQETGETVETEIMIPLVAIPRELSILKEMIDRVAGEVAAARKMTTPYLVGTMIELPRACLMADKIAVDAAFFSFGTNDLTQTTYGLSRDDAARFLQDYERRGILPVDPFITLDPEGVGELVKIAVERGRRQRPELKLGICGEHGGDPASVRFCARVGLDYVSCSPFRVPIARLAAAQAALADTSAAAHATD